MAGASVKIDISDVARKLGLLKSSLVGALRQAVARLLLQVSRQSFERQASPEGAAWLPLSLVTAQQKARSRFRKQGILRRTGTLVRSLHSGVEGRLVFVSTAPLPYAAIHQFGGQAGRGRKVRIPARPYLPSPETAERLAREEIELQVSDAINQAGLK